MPQIQKRACDRLVFLMHMAVPTKPHLLNVHLRPTDCRNLRNMYLGPFLQMCKLFHYQFDVDIAPCVGYNNHHSILFSRSSIASVLENCLVSYAENRIRLLMLVPNKYNYLESRIKLFFKTISHIYRLAAEKPK